MNCKYAHKLINKSVDGLANPKDKAILDEHLSECPRCSEEYADIVSLDGVLTRALPLQATLGDDFATRIAERLPARGGRLSILKEAFVMSRLKYAVPAMVVVVIVIGSLLASHFKNNQVLAAVRSAMAQVESLHFRLDLVGPKPPDWQSPEIWMTRDASKKVDQLGWNISKEGGNYNYSSRYKILFITRSGDTGKNFGMMVDPIETLRVTEDPSVHLTVRHTEHDGKPMQQIEAESTGEAPKRSKQSVERSRRIRQRRLEIIQEQMGIRTGRPVHLTTMRGRPGKQVYLVNPSTNLVQSVDLYTQNRQGGGWRLILRAATIDYNVNLPDDFFDIKPPPGTKVYDLRDDLDSKPYITP